MDGNIEDECLVGEHVLQAWYRKGAVRLSTESQRLRDSLW